MENKNLKKENQEKNIEKFVVEEMASFETEKVGVNEKLPIIKELKEVSKKMQKKQQKQLKIEKKLKKQALDKVLSEDKLSKNVINLRENTIKKQSKIDKKNNKRIEKSNKYLLSKEDEVREIYLTIDKFNTNGKKTVVYFIDSFFPLIDGVVTVLDNYARVMNKYYNVVVCAPKHDGVGQKMDNYFVLYADSMFIKSQGYDLAFPQFDAEFKKYISLLKIDLIHLQSPFNLGNFGLSLAKKRNVPCFITFHSQFKQNFYNAVKNETIANILTKILMVNYEKATLALTMNDFARNLMREYGVKNQIELVPNATNMMPKEFSKEYEDGIIAKHNINKDKFNLIFVGRFVEVKNVYFIIDTIADLYQKNKDFEFIFLGFGPEEEKMKKICKEKDIENIVKFTGKIDGVDEKSAIIKNADLLYFPSVYDTDGIVKIECACYGVPTLCIEGTGAASYITNDENGFVCKNDKNEFVEKLDFLIKNVDFVKKIGKNAKRDIYITWEETCERLKDLYEKYLNSYTFQKAKKNKNKTAKKTKVKP